MTRGFFNELCMYISPSGQFSVLTFLALSVGSHDSTSGIFVIRSGLVVSWSGIVVSTYTALSTILLVLNLSTDMKACTFTVYNYN